MTYNPQTDLMGGTRLAWPQAQLFPEDDYFFRMAETDWLSGRGDTFGVKSFFIREAPFGGSYALLGGITAALRGIADLRLDDPDFRRGMEDMDYRADFVDWLVQRRRLKVIVYAPPEGTPFIGHEPIVTIIGPLPDIRLAEGILIEAMNFPTLSLTKWHRLVWEVRPANVLDFGRRRAQNHMKATLYAMLAGCFATSNSEMRRFFNFLVIGTMGHEWIQSFGDVREAFHVWLVHQPGKPVGLVDTLQCMEQDFPIWLDEVYEHREAIINANSPVWGWRNDSGDLAALTITQYDQFEKHPLALESWFADRMRIVLTNEIDEWAAYSIIRQIKETAGPKAERILERIIWAAGTKPGTCNDQPSLGGVAKLMEAEGYACIKLAFDAYGNPGLKTSIPGFNLSAVIRDGNGDLVGILTFPDRRYKVKSNGRLWDLKEGAEVKVLPLHHKDNPGLRRTLADYQAILQQQKVYDSLHDEGFTGHWDNPTITSVPERIEAAVEALPREATRLDKPAVIPLWVTPDLFDLRQRMITQGVLREDMLK